MSGAATFGAGGVLPEDIHTRVLESIDHIFNERFDLSIEETKKIIKRHPSHPAGYFFHAVALEAWMAYFQSDRKEEEFYRYCDAAVEEAEAMLDRNPRDPWALFFIGGAYGYKGLHESRYERWITAFRHGWKGVSVLSEIEKLNVEMPDIYYGIGSYEYWRSAMTKVLRWMPGVGDKRAEGIRKLAGVAENGIYTRISATEALAYIYINESRFEEAVELADTMLARYPACLTFCWIKAEALFGKGKYEEAAKNFRYILGRCEAEKYDNHYNAVVCHYWLARIFLQTNQYLPAVAECNRMEYYTLDDAIRKRLSAFFKEAEGIKSKAEVEALKSGPLPPVAAPSGDKPAVRKRNPHSK
jgi:tetratricopeptide (TPR) repeat protein